jgi:K+/H+ antiporter YhaU regulatory subunit KhtT
MQQMARSISPITGINQHIMESRQEMAMALEMMPECARTFLSHSMSIPCHSMHCKVQKHQPFSGKKLLIFVEGQLGQGERP